MILLDGSHLTLDQLVAIADRHAEVSLAPQARARVTASRAVVETMAAGEAAVYGINTGFGNFAETRVAKADLAALQVNLLRSHAAGVDTPLAPRTVRAMMALRANVLAKGFSGIRVETIEALLALLNHGIHPARAEPRLGRGERRPRAARAPGAGADRRGTDVGRAADRSGAAALAAAGLAPVDLGPKEGLALINGTQASAAVLALALAGAAAPGPRGRRDRARSASTRCSARASRSIRACTRRVRSRDRRSPPTICGGCSTRAR